MNKRNPLKIVETIRMISGLIQFCIWKYTDDICIRLPMHFIMYWSVTVHMSSYVFSFYRFLYIVHLAFLIFFEILIILHLAFLIFWKSIMSFFFLHRSNNFFCMFLGLCMCVFPMGFSELRKSSNILYIQGSFLKCIVIYQYIVKTKSSWIIQKKFIST